MIKSVRNLIVWIALPIALTLANSSCATKKYVRQQVAPAHKQVAVLEKQTNDKISYLHHKEEREVSQLNQRVDTTDQRVGQLADATQEAQGTASRAMEKARTNAAAISRKQWGKENARTYHLLDEADVLFGFGRSTLTPQAKRTLDEIASRARRTPHPVVEVAGFTDAVGSRSSNYALSRRRAEAVQRYLVQQNIAPRSIHIVGMGASAAPRELVPEGGRGETGRRAQVRLFASGVSRGTAAREQ